MLTEKTKNSTTCLTRDCIRHSRKRVFKSKKPNQINYVTIMKHFVSKLLIWGQNGTNALVVRQVSPRLIAIKWTKFLVSRPIMVPLNLEFSTLGLLRNRNNLSIVSISVSCEKRLLSCHFGRTVRFTLPIVLRVQSLHARRVFYITIFVYFPRFQPPSTSDRQGCSRRSIWRHHLGGLKTQRRDTHVIFTINMICNLEVTETSK